MITVHPPKKALLTNLNAQITPKKTWRFLQQCSFNTLPTDPHPMPLRTHKNIYGDECQKRYVKLFNLKILLSFFTATADLQNVPGKY